MGLGTVRYDAALRKWVITAPPHILLRVKRVFERIAKNEFGSVLLADTPENCLELEWFLQRYPMDVEAPQRLFDQATVHREREATIAKVLAPDYKPPPVELAVPLREYQQVAVALARANGALLLGDEVGLGKAQPLTAKVLTLTGWRAMGDLAVGDEIVDPDGGTAQVEAIYPQGERDVFRVATADGATTECCDDHLWLLYTTNDRQRGTSRVLPLREFREDLQRRAGPNLVNKYFVPVMQPAQFTASAQLPLHPYLLGALIGDGCMSAVKGGLTFTQIEPEVLSRVEACLPSGVKLKRCAEGAITWRLQREATSGLNPAMEALRMLGIYGCLSPEKWIPPMYLHADVEARIELLRGLMDTDGDCTLDGTTVFSTSSARLLADVVELVGSLGGYASTYTKSRPTYVHKGETRVGLPAHRAHIRVPFNPFSLKRKADRWHPPYMARAITKVERVGRALVQCIKVSSKRQLYVTDGFMVTHNTASAIGLLADPKALPALVVTLTHLPKQWEAEIQRFAPALQTHVLKGGRPYDLTAGPRGKKVPPPDVIITNYHKLRGWADVLGAKVQTVIFDEIQELRTGAESDKWKAARHIAERAHLKAGLSATPIYNYGGEIYNILSVLFPHTIEPYAEFQREWCGGNNYGTDRTSIKDPAAFGLYLRDQGKMLRRTRADVGRELPDLSKIPYVINADIEEFDKIESSAVKLAHVLLAQGGLEKGAKLRAAEELSWLLRQATGIAKAPYVADFVRLLVEQGEKVVLYGWHKSVYEIWRERLKDLKPAFYTGDESPTQKALSRDRFVNGDTSLLVLSLRAGAGLDGLQHVSRTVVFGEIDWSPGVHTQCIGRVFRDGQKEKVAAYFLLANHGSDPVVADVLGVKKAQSDSLLDPTAEIVAAFTGGASDVKKLAETFLKQRGLPVPTPPKDASDPESKVD